MRRIDTAGLLDGAHGLFELFSGECGFGAHEDLVDDQTHAVLRGLALRIERERAAVVVQRTFARGFEEPALVERFLGQVEFGLHRILFLRQAGRSSGCCCLGFDRRCFLAGELLDAEPDGTDQDQQAGGEGAVGHHVILAAAFAGGARRLTMGRRAEVGVLRDRGFEGQTGLAVRQRREQESENTSRGRELHERGAVLALAGDDHHEFREMLRELRHQCRHVRGAGRIDDQDPRLQARQAISNLIEIRCMGGRAAARGCLADGFDQGGIAAEDQDGGMVGVGFAENPCALGVVDFQIHFLAGTIVLSIRHGPTPRGFHAEGLILTYAKSDD